MILGENQILSQVKRSYQDAAALGDPKLELGRAFEMALGCGKKVRTQTNIGKLGMSLGGVTLDLIKQIYHQDDEIRIALVGAGEVAEEVLRALQSYKKARITVVNRTKKNANRIKKKFNFQDFQFLPIDKIYQVINENNLIITSTNTEYKLIMAEKLKKLRKRKDFLFFLDLSVPRNVDPEVSKLRDVVLYSIDDLQKVIKKNKIVRSLELGKAGEMIDSQMVLWEEWKQKRDIVDFWNLFHETEDKKKHNEDLTKSIKNTSLKKLFSMTKDEREMWLDNYKKLQNQSTTRNPQKETPATEKTSFLKKDTPNKEKKKVGGRPEEKQKKEAMDIKKSSIKKAKDNKAIANDKRKKKGIKK